MSIIKYKATCDFDTGEMSMAFSSKNILSLENPKHFNAIESGFKQLATEYGLDYLGNLRLEETDEEIE